jgi:hypothetical protein
MRNAGPPPWGRGQTILEGHPRTLPLERLLVTTCGLGQLVLDKLICSKLKTYELGGDGTGQSHFEGLT